jgi:3-methyladenine DNA glycosylase/8-oxoguanine DNA glycosylase
MSVLATVRRLFTGTARTADGSASSPPPDPAAVARALLTLADHVRQDDTDRRAIVALLQRLPDSLQSLPDLTRQQARMGEAIAAALVEQRIRDQSIEEILQRIAEGVGRQTDTFGLVQQQLDLNHEAAARVADGVTSLSQGIGELATGQRRNADALQSILDQARQRDADTERIHGRLHLWLVFCTALSAGALVACLLLAWALLSRSNA